MLWPRFDGQSTTFLCLTSEVRYNKLYSISRVLKIKISIKQKRRLHRDRGKASFCEGSRLVYRFEITGVVTAERTQEIPVFRSEHYIFPELALEAPKKMLHKFSFFKLCTCYKKQVRSVVYRVFFCCSEPFKNCFVFL